MKIVFVFLAILVGSAVQAKSLISCETQEVNEAVGQFSVPVNINADGELLNITGEGSVSYLYSSSNMKCVGFLTNKIDCVGFWYDNGDGGVAQVSVHKGTDGKLVAEFDDLPYKKHIVAPCQITKIK